MPALSFRFLPAGALHFAALSLVLGGSACSGGRTHDAAAGATASDIVLDTVASGLTVPWGLAFAPDGRIFVTERVGRIRVIEHDSLRADPWATLSVAQDGEAGLMGIALAPDFDTSHQLFVVATSATGSTYVNRVVRFTERDGRGTDPTVVIDGIPSNLLHAGDAIAFGPDGNLYVATGDARDPAHARDTRSLAGKILRYTPRGEIPADNPIPGSAVFAYGLRNVQGLAWTADRQLFATEHGPSGFENERFRRDNDELNVIHPGADYGWPLVAGRSWAGASVAPLLTWTPAIAPSGLAVYAGDAFPAWRGSLLVGALRGEQLRRVVLARRGDDWRVVAESTVIASIGRVRAVAMGRDGQLYITTSNRDDRAVPRAGDDHVFRVRPHIVPR